MLYKASTRNAKIDTPKFLLFLAVLNVFGGFSKLDLVDSLSKTKGTETLVTTLRSWTQVDEHESFSVST